MKRSHLNMEHLELLLAVARTGSLAQSAAHLGLTQPALSYRLREAERRLGVALFTKAPGKRVIMTPAAQRLLPTARLVIGQLLRAESDVERIARGFLYTVRLSLPSRSCFHWLPQFLGFLQTSHPELDVDFEVRSGVAPLASLARGNVDVAILAGEPPREHFESRLLYTDALLALVPTGHELARASCIEPQNFAEAALVTDEHPLESDAHAIAALQPFGIVPARYVPAGSPESVAQLVASGFGHGIVPARFAGRWQRDDLAFRPIGTRGSRVEWHVAIRRCDADGTPAEHLAERLDHWFERKDAPGNPIRTDGAVLPR